MAVKDDAIILNVAAGYGWFALRKYDLSLTMNGLTLTRIVATRNSIGPRRESPATSRNDSIMVPYAEVRRIQFYAPPVQKNKAYYRIGFYVIHGPKGGRPRKLRIVINARQYIVQRLHIEGMPRKMSESILRRNELLVEYGEKIRDMLMSVLPPEFAKSVEWQGPITAEKRP